MTVKWCVSFSIGYARVCPDLQRLCRSMDGIPFFEGDNETPFPGTVYLGHLTDSDAGFTLWCKQDCSGRTHTADTSGRIAQDPLADNVPLLNKEVQVEVPDVPSGRNYFIMCTLACPPRV